MKTTDRPLTIGLTYDLRSEYLANGYTEEQVAEFDTESTIDALVETITGLGLTVDRIGSSRALCSRLVAGDRWDLVFNIAEGVGGRCREAHVPAILETYGIPYTFSDPLTCALTLDKALAKRHIHHAGLRTPNFFLVTHVDDLANTPCCFPLFAKPNAEGTGKGIDGRSRIDGRDQLVTVCQSLIERGLGPVLVEEYLPGREFTVGIWGTGATAQVIGTMEIDIKEAAGKVDYTYETKEKCEELVKYSTPPDDDLRARIEDLALAAYRVLDCRDAGRVDIRLDILGEPAFIEVNPLAGIHPHHSDLPMIATRAGLTYEELLGGILRSAFLRAGIAKEFPAR
ncbi:MAG: D-alanine--D-alanine ligase [Lentisphaeria bacterium]|nr:D-alanine--D-alanine ligase [Lentisphaeria bacterium]